MQALQKIQVEKEVWLSSKEAVELLGTDRKGLLRKRVSGEIISRDRAGGKGGGYEYLLSSFPEELRTRYCIDNDLAVSDCGNEVLLARKELTPKQESVALARTKLVNQFLVYESETWGNITSKKKIFIDAYNSGNGVFTDVFALIGKTSWQTVERWKTIFLENESDYKSLAPGYQFVKQSTVTVEEAQLLLKLALHPNQPQLSEVVRMAMDVFVADNFASIKSEATYRRYLNNWKKKNNDQWIFYREGAKALNDKSLPWIMRDYSRIEVGDILVGDGHVLNFEVINPFTGKPKRMMMPLFFDMKSSMPLGWEIAPTENVRSIAVALYRSIMRLGKIPKMVYLDNGRAFKAKYFQGIKKNFYELEGLFARLGIKVMTAWPYHGQSKTIERFFKTFGELERMLPTYTGTSIEMQPPRLNRGERLHRKLHERIVEGTSFDLLSAHRAVAWWFDQYAARPQSGHLNGKAPVELFEPARGSGVNKADLLFLMMREEVAQIYRNGIRFLGEFYWNDKLYGYRDKVTIRYDLVDNDSVFVYLPDGSFFCQAFKQKKIHPAAHLLGTPEDVEMLNAAIANRKNLIKSSTTDARAYLTEEVYPAAQKQLIEANIIRLNNEQEKLPDFIEPKKTGTDNIPAELLRPLKDKIVDVEDEKAWWE